MHVIIKCLHLMRKIISSMFKIICLETLPRIQHYYTITEGMNDYEKRAVELRCARYDSTMKVLKPNKTFWFYKGYIKDENGDYSRTKNVTVDDFFTCGNTNVSICSIVGENGTGKSSLLELYFRLINNASFALKDGLPVQKFSLCFVRDVYAKLVFEVDNHFYALEQQDTIVSFYDQSEPAVNWQYDYDNSIEQTLNTNEAKKRLGKLFYTIVVNYSQYGYNTSDYIAEWDDTNQNRFESDDCLCWISSLFHKNDSYQTPIVLNPFRERGNININSERDLTHKRLFKLVMANPEILNKVLRNKKAKNFIFDVDNDLNPIPSHRYSSKRVLRMMTQMHFVTSMEQGINSKTVYNIGRRITTAWGHALGYYIEPILSDDYWGDMDLVRTINYIVYKTLKISTIYALYYKYHDCFYNKKNVQEYISALNKDNSHITLKIRKCLAFLNFRHYSTGNFVGGHVVGNSLKFDDYNKIICDCIKRTDEVLSKKIKDQYTTLAEGNKVEPHIWELDDLLPAPSFRADIILEDDMHKLIRFSSLSSGEKQMIYSLCTIMYQLSNIVSVWMNGENSDVKYRNINLAFDEIELYSHPKFQLMLIDMVLSSIESLKLSLSININIMIATHSPFVLSDLPSSNILCLKDGAPSLNKHNIDNSFCANVYDILNNQFFMSRFVGDFAAAKLDKMIEESKQDNLTPEEKNNLLKRISYIGDSFIKGLLKKKLNAKKMNRI